LNQLNRIQAPKFAITGAVVFALSVLVGCFGDDFDDGSGPPGRDGGAVDMVDAMIAPACPEAPPRVGERCPTVEEHGTTCTYTISQCSYNGSVYDKTNDICCTPGGNWYECGMNETPCDREAAQDAGTDI
jgi:hypothetical protein